ncbi:MAG: 50S ribosomal protein L18 [Alphaproteobacteria bacterium]|nr:50S ribosomal protein L18 [Alphaproteobacteria bacterium]
MSESKTLFARRRQRNRYRIAQHAGGKPRLSVFRSSKHIYAQIIDDENGVTLASASSIEVDLRKSLKIGSNRDAAAQIGKLVAERAVKLGISTVVFDRGGYLFHGRVKSLADGAREGGLVF